MERIHNSYISNALKLAFARKYNKHVSEVTKEFIGTLKEIDLSENNIKDIKGIEFATNATYLNLTRNNIHDASYISNLINLSTLELSGNRIEDISFLKNLKKLESIALENNNISEVPNLDLNENLTIINLDNNKIIDLSQLNTSKFKDATLLAFDQCVVLDPIEVEYGKTAIIKSNVKWDSNTTVFFDNVQVSGNYENVYTDTRPSILYSISEVVIENIKSRCILKMDFYYEDPKKAPRVLSGTLIQPICVINEESREEKLEEYDNIYNENLSTIKGTLKIKGGLVSNLSSKLITIIREDGSKKYINITENGDYCINGIAEGNYIVLFPVLYKYIYTSPSVYILNIDSRGEYIIDAVAMNIDYIEYKD